MSREWPQLLGRITLKLPFRADFRAEIDPARDGWLITVTLYVPDVLTGELTTVNTRMPVPPLGSMAEDDAMALLRATLKNALIHEMDESLWLDGKHWRDPHAQEAA